MGNLLSKGDFQLFSYDKKHYVFFPGNLQVLEITNPEMLAYFNMCLSGRVDACTLDIHTANRLTKAIKEVNVMPSCSLAEPKEFMLILNVTHGCNMACKYCFASTLQDRKNVMSLSVARRAVLDMIENKPSVERYIIYFFGGEPLLHKQFIKDAVEIAKEEIIAKRNKQVCFLLNTNATLLDDTILQFFKEEHFTLTLSIDGPEYVNDANRTYLNGRGSFRRIIGNIEKLKRTGVNFNLRATFNPKMMNLLDTFIFFESLEVSYSYAFTVNSKDKDLCETRFADDDISRLDQELEVVMDYLMNKFLNGKTVYSAGFIKSMERLKKGNVRTHGCEAGRNSITIDEVGRYYTCQNMLPFEDGVVGTISGGVDLGKLAEFRSKDLLSLSNCSQCWARCLCGGGCEVERYSAGSPEGELSQRCKVTQLEWTHFIRAYIKLNDFFNNKFNSKNELNYERFERVGA